MATGNPNWTILNPSEEWFHSVPNQNTVNKIKNLGLYEDHDNWKDFNFNILHVKTDINWKGVNYS